MNVLNEINEFVNLSYQLNAARTKLRKQTIQFRKALNNNHAFPINDYTPYIIDYLYYLNQQNGSSNEEFISLLQSVLNENVNIALDYVKNVNQVSGFKEKYKHSLITDTQLFSQISQCCLKVISNTFVSSDIYIKENIWLHYRIYSDFDTLFKNHFHRMYDNFGDLLLINYDRDLIHTLQLFFGFFPFLKKSNINNMLEMFMTLTTLQLYKYRYSFDKFINIISSRTDVSSKINMFQNKLNSAVTLNEL